MTNDGTNDMSNDPQRDHVPWILAPAGGRQAFLAALAAGADGVYCGLKSFSARMEAINFSIDELAALAAPARAQGTRVLVALNSMLRPGELEEARRTVADLERRVRPHALIIQDLGFIPLVRDAGFSGEVHLSTLANVSFAKALALVNTRLGVDQVVVPRELNIDEVKQLAAGCPDGMGLEMFIHGALCYGVSGRCYWSSFMGGKSGLRGRCVQPCRRVYAQGERRSKAFSCLDLSLAVLVKVLRDIPQIRTWKIEGRKKGPHYVYYTVTAYRMLRDHGRDPQAKKDALSLLAHALGRPGTHYHFLPQRPQNPVRVTEDTGSGLMIGRVKGGGGQAYLNPREALLPGDMLRVGTEDESWHGTRRVGKFVPKGGRFHLKVTGGRGPGSGVAVYLVDRLEPALGEKMAAVQAQGDAHFRQVVRCDRKQGEAAAPNPFPVGAAGRQRPRHIGGPGKGALGGKKGADPVSLTVYRRLVRRPGPGETGYWLSQETRAAAAQDAGGKLHWWLPPVIWPEDEAAWEDLVQAVCRDGGRRFVLNAPWQVALFQHPGRCRLWAGPFCNTANPAAVTVLKSLGFDGVVASPELGGEDLLLLPRQSPLPLGLVTTGVFPLSISRCLADTLLPEVLFTSPKGEGAWARRQGSDYWIYPDWKLDLSEKQRDLAQAGYRMFVHLSEPPPRGVSFKRRPGLWNWEVGLR